MVDATEIAEMKNLGVTKRKSESKEGEYEYTFKFPCKDCGNMVDWCNCAKSLEDVKKILASEKRHCGPCASKPENCDKDLNEMIEQALRENPGADRYEMYMEICSEAWDGYETYETDDGTEYWDCDCPI